MATLKAFGMDIPIVDARSGVQDFTNFLIVNPGYYGYTAAEICQRGIIIGNGYSIKESSLDPGTATVESYLPLIHDITFTNGYKVECGSISLPSPTGGASGSFSMVDIVDGGGNVIASINRNYLCVQATVRTNGYERTANTYMLAIRIPQTTGNKYPAYAIVAAYEYKSVTISSGAISITYSNLNSYTFNPNKYDTAFYESETPPEPEPPFDPSDPEDYDPDIDDTSDTVSIPSDPTLGLTDAGFIHVYNPSAGALAGLGEYIFPDPKALLANDVLTALIKLCQTLADVNLINYVIDCHIIPYTPHTNGTAHIKVGFRDTEISAAVVDQDYVTVACGSLNIAEYFHGFQDYLLTNSKLYLPFIGFVDMKPEFWQAGTLTVDYKFNVIDGSFMCYIRSTSSKSNLAASVIAQYAGNACYHIPITGQSYAQLAAGYVGAAAGIASAGSSVSSVLGAATSALNTMGNAKSVQQSNGYSASAAMMGIRKPYLMIERPCPSYPSKYAHDKGYPTNISTQLSNISGYTEISDIDLTGIPLTSNELDELRELLSSGVYF